MDGDDPSESRDPGAPDDEGPTGRGGAGTADDRSDGEGRGEDSQSADSQADDSQAGDRLPPSEPPDRRARTDDGGPPVERDPDGNHRDLDPRDGPIAAVRWFRYSDDEWALAGREVLASALAVALVGVLLFAITGVWPPMVAVESPSMAPHMQPGDLVVVMDEHRLVPGAAQAGTGVVTHRVGSQVGYRTFGDAGDVIVFKPPGERGPPVIHRAHFWVEAGENWVERADPTYLREDSCDAYPSCPAAHDGFVTKGDNNRYYDQVIGISDPVRPSWIRGTAEVRIPWLGCVRLLFSGNAPPRCSPV